MSTVFLVGELGPSQRDLPPLLTLARRFEKRGHRAVLVLGDVMRATMLMQGMDAMALLQAPVWCAGAKRRDPDARAALTAYGDYLGSIGLDDGDEVARMIEAWRKLMDTITPDLIIQHNSPGICLAASGRVPVISIGDGFTVPPAGVEAFPDLIAGRQPRYDQTELLGTVNDVLGHVRTPKLRSLPSLFFTAGRYPFVLPSLDPYKGWRTRPARGPMDPLPPLYPEPKTPSAYVSLAGDFYKADAVLTALAEKGLPAKAFLRGIAPDFLDGLSWPGVKVVTHGPDLNRTLYDQSLVIHDGGVGLTTVALARGRAQLIFPSTPENAITAARAQELGIAIVAQGDPTPERIVALIDDAAKLTPHVVETAENLDRENLSMGVWAAEKRGVKLMG